MSESEEDKREGFKIEDKRRFTATGQARDLGSQSTEDAPEVDDEAKSEDPPEARSSDAGEQGGEDEGDLAGELNFSSFVVGLASQAFMFLGLAPDPHSGVVSKDLAQARAMIDILAMLRDKTSGNLDEDEERLMEEMLYELQLQYVREVRGDVSTEGNNQ
ncbi:MAG: DUF1844 domain-containing protein [Candidatus Binatia bacterium]